MLVTEGKVAVAVAKSDTSAGAPAAPTRAPEETPAVMLEAGQRTVLDPAAGGLAAAPVLNLTAPEMAERMSWRARRFAFTGAPLSEAIHLLNRYNDVQFVLMDATLAKEQISGIFRADNVDGFVHMLVSVVPVAVEHSGNRILVRWRR